MELDPNSHPVPPCVLSELLRRMLSLVDYYGQLEANESLLFELKLALIRAIERLDAEKAAKDAAARGIEPDYARSLRKGPHGQSMDLSQLDKELDKRP